MVLLIQVLVCHILLNIIFLEVALDISVCVCVCVCVCNLPQSIHINIINHFELSTETLLYYIFFFTCQVMSDSATSWSTVLEAPLSSTISWSLLTFMSTELVMLSNRLILC